MYQPETITSDIVADPVIAAISRLAQHFGLGVGGDLFDLLPRNRQGRLPFHQAGAALDVAGLNFEEHRLSRLPRRAEFYPALVSLQDGGAAALLEVSAGEVLVWREGDGEAAWQPIGELQAEYAGALISVIGDPDALRDKDAPWHAKSRTHWFWSELRKERKAFRPALIASLLINLLALSLPLFTMNVYDRVLPNAAEASLWVLAIGVLIAFALEFALRLARTNVIDHIGRALDLKLSQKIFSRLLATPLSGRQGSTGALAARVNEYQIVRDFFASTTVVLMVDIAFLVLFVAVIAYIAGWLALIPVVAMVLMAGVGFVLQRKVIDAARAAQADQGLQQTMLVESMAGMETLKSVGGERSMLGRWSGLSEISAHSQLRLRRIHATAVTLASTFQQISSVSLIIGGYYLFVSGEITMGAIIAIVMLASRSLAPAGQIAFLLTRGRQVREALASIESLFASDDERRSGAMSFPAASGKGHQVRLDNVTFAYPNTSVPALDDVSMDIAPGERIAIIGRVASGKSTLGRVLCGLYAPTEGALLVNGIDAQQYRPSALRKAFRFVGQDANLFTGSIRDNLAIGAPGAADEDVIRALRMSGADDFLARDAAGFDRQVGEQGRQLSGGQRSFLALSRALVGPFDLLFLDEPTGAMDSRTEAFLVERLRSALSPEQTLVVSTHRPALFALCSRIVVMDGGRIVADGPKDEILAASRTGGISA